MGSNAQTQTPTKTLDDPILFNFSSQLINLKDYKESSTRRNYNKKQKGVFNFYISEYK